ncbi:virulence-associated E family protein [Bradyrhizobium barranii subsp. barranii]|uniref:Virulence-associated E family protein n=1 Tax=Bradyrhizobium barranii subsp. barranii TaxID=2823807 RepID=A0A7Z0QAH7_9BRAD|nr:virulence-associated E family protein [Bradyrhizobium barranii]UGX93690.1 virulence-associated E family protein [Bradyrhizobium barranii subsp. barranii]
MARRKKLTEEELAKADAAANAIIGSPLNPIEPMPINWPVTVGKGKPDKNSQLNAGAVIRALGLDCRLDVFHQEYLVSGHALSQFGGKLQDHVVRKLVEVGWQATGHELSEKAYRSGLLRECEENQFHPVKDYLKSLNWDRKPRLDTWLTTYVGVEDTPLVRAQGAIVMTAAVARIMKPGTKYDHVLVLEGPEGARKSSAVRILANGTFDGDENFSESKILGEDERKQQELTTGKWFYELAELAGLRKADQYALKNFVTKQTERARAAYAHFITEQPRTCVFIGTFNTDATTGALVEYLNPGDQRRWWPVRVGDIDIATLQRDRDQLLAEAMVAYDLGMPLYLDKALEAEARGEAARREMVDPLSDTLSDVDAAALKMLQEKVAPNGAEVAVAGHNGGKLLTIGDEAKPAAFITDSEIWVSAKHVTACAPSSRQNDGKGITAAMRKLGWVQVRDRRTGSVERGYARTRDDLSDLGV